MRQLRNIVVINDFDYINGGTSQIAVNTANAFVAYGYNVYFFSAVSNPEKEDLLPQVIKLNTNQYDILKDPDRLRAFRQGIWNKKAENELSAFLYSLEPAESIVHVHGWIKALSPSIGRVLSTSKFQTILTLHDYFVACPNGGFFNYQTNAICNLVPMSAKCMCTNCDARSFSQKIWRVVRQSVQDNFGQIPNGIKNFVVVSKFSEKILRPYLPPKAKVFHIGNPVNYPLAVPQRANISSNRVLFVGRLSPEKGAELACAAARKSHCRITVIGDGELRETLMSRYPEAEFKGWLQPSEVFEEMLQSSVLVFPSVLYETLGLSVLEAFSVGLPVIVSDRSAASELVTSKNGILFESGNSEDLARKMSEMMGNLVATEKMSRYIFEAYWGNPNTLEKYMKELLEAYNVVLNNEVAKSTV